MFLSVVKFAGSDTVSGVFWCHGEGKGKTGKVGREETATHVALLPVEGALETSRTEFLFMQYQE